MTMATGDTVDLQKARVGDYGYNACGGEQGFTRGGFWSTLEEAIIAAEADRPDAAEYAVWRIDSKPEWSEATDTWFTDATLIARWDRDEPIAMVNFREGGS